MSGTRNIALGIFLAGGLLLFAIGLFWIGDREKLFTDHVELFTEFSNVSGLSRGARVRVSGLDAGEVLEVTVPARPSARFRVHFRVASHFQPILRMDSVASIQNDGLVGNKFLQIDAGTDAGAESHANATIPSREPVEIATLLNQANDTVKNANNAVTDVRTGINDTVKALLLLNNETTELIDGVGKTVDKFTKTGDAMAQDIGVVVAKVRKGEGTIGKLLNDDGIYNELHQAAKDGEGVLATFKAASNDLKSVTDDLKSRDLGGKLEKVANNVDNLATESLKAVRTLTGPDGVSGGLMSDVRQTLNSANETMANFADGSEAIKRNFLFRGFFNKRGFFDIDDVTVRDYAEGRFMPDRQKVSEWVEGADIFATPADKPEQLSEAGKKKLDLAMAGFMRYAKTDPFVIEGWAGTGASPENVLRSRQRAILVSEYLVKRFNLKPNYVAAMPMNAVAAEGRSRDGIGLVLFAAKPPSKK